MKDDKFEGPLKESSSPRNTKNLPNDGASLDDVIKILDGYEEGIAPKKHAECCGSHG